MAKAALGTAAASAVAAEKGKAEWKSKVGINVYLI